MTNDSDIPRVYREWFAAADEFLKTGGVLAFSRKSLKTIETVRTVPEHWEGIDPKDLARLDRAIELASQRLNEVAGNIDPSNTAVVTPAPLIQRIDRTLINDAALNLSFKEAMGLILQVIPIKAEGIGLEIPRKAGPHDTRMDNFQSALRRSFRIGPY